MKKARAVLILISVLVACGVLCRAVRSGSAAPAGEEARLIEAAKGLYSKDAAVREKSRKVLIAAGDPAVGVMNKMLSCDPNCDTDLFRNEYVNVLAQIRTRFSTDTLVRMVAYSRTWENILMKPEGVVRENCPAYAALVDMGQDAVPALGFWLGADEMRNIMILRALKNIGGPEATERVGKHVRSLEGRLAQAKHDLEEMEKKGEAQKGQKGKNPVPPEGTK